MGEGTFEPLDLACNPHGSVQAGVHAVLLDAAMNFAINAALVGRDRTNATIEMSTELIRPARRGEEYARTRRSRASRTSNRARSGHDYRHARRIISRSTGTFLVHRGTD